MKISEIVKNIDYMSIIGEDREIESLSYNTSSVKPNSMFFCIEGVKTDGHIFAQKAIDSGASAIVVSKDIDINGNASIIKVKDTREAMALMSSNFYGKPSQDINIIGITGTNGKTTSTFMIKSILDAYNKKTALLGTIYNIIGDKKEEAKRTTPESMDLQKMFFDMKKEGIEYCIMEVSSHSLELKRVFDVKFKAGIFTNLTQDHLDFHGTMENYFNAKMKLFECCDIPVINVDDKYGKRAVDKLNRKIITFGIENDADVKGQDVIISEKGTNFKLKYKDESVSIGLHLPGKFNVYNALGAAAACLEMGIPLSAVKKGLENLESVPGRSEKIISKRGFTVVIDYAHTPDGIENILKTAREYTKGRLTTLFGCGGDRDKTKRPLMGKAAGELSDFCIVTSDNPRTEDPKSIIEDILPGIDKTGCAYVIIEDRKEAIKYALDNAKAGDVIVIAGKGHESYQILKEKTIHFDEREIVNELLNE
ncbi:UDP-N-acetylmuramoylalanyl-D-glutamate--2,6-diaminopimelate ligase [Caloramator quimbayensis]|uniref:UDP-N-acetylmuramoyl-L-alanyl-D-glutamate--2,6-diaminopimelate ligase n=1 Tax=Caloramator quimbayensis TaxID=1147123 RepID=A0A1T4X1H6_9CLOT|nr:UDP-N-acetylmuramoyl-L-alanyl-D-glutamate--2,6-diaminopimelate ligase [Caloramator quimbayensis]SKA83406.1 UDP-N-acetylmuramoylalanyl-D-glutamate--2,6-diaminopimelate ligase [Caloramator quimbayensis]